ncbi:MAG: acetate--CoA ligase family protein [Thermoguttaceae bacterium]|nr:acetate--CoA ligase family protein [Thermoguttaceae bacterium]MDW8078247.1 acetate--CoA ligase family protein [Thermoguttaceae bacterium]
MTQLVNNAVSSAVDRPRLRLDGIFYPKSLAVVGATNAPGTVPYDILANIVNSGFQGKVYAVAPGKKSICGVPAFRYVLDLPEPVDLAVIVFPAEVVDRALEQCGQRGIPAAIVISAGFREVGAEGRRREERIKELCRQYGITLIGPNCLGVINTDPVVQLNASFARAMPQPGPIAMLSQSGALCTAILDYARQRHIGFSKFVSFGNKAVVSEIDLLEYLAEDPKTSIILLYLEEIAEGRRLYEVARRITRGPNAKPILVIKSARTGRGAAAASSHTGAMATEDAICDAVFESAGMIRVDTLEEMFDTAILYTNQPLPRGPRVGIVTNAGGPGVLATDAAIRFGLEVPPLGQATRQRLKEHLPATANMTNPVDVIGDARADRYQAAIAAVLDDPEIDQLLVILTPQSMTDIMAVAETVCAAAGSSAKALAASFMGGVDVAPAVVRMEEARVPHYRQPEDALRAMAHLQQVLRWRQSAVGDGLPEIPEEARRQARQMVDESPAGLLPESQALALLGLYGLQVPSYRVCRSPEQAVAAAEEIGYPVVLRIQSPAVIHKTEVGGVLVDVRSAEDVRRGFALLVERLKAARPDAPLEGILVRRMIPPGHEMIIGGKRDPSFGPVVMVGLGGIYVELWQAVAFALAPATAGQVRKMLTKTKADKLLSGLRGQPAADVNAFVDAVVRLSMLLADCPRIAEMDLNPVIVGPVGYGIADARIVLS